MYIDSLHLLFFINSNVLKKFSPQILEYYQLSPIPDVKLVVVVVVIVDVVVVDETYDSSERPSVASSSYTVKSHPRTPSIHISPVYRSKILAGGICTLGFHHTHASATPGTQASRPHSNYTEVWSQHHVTLTSSLEASACSANGGVAQGLGDGPRLPQLSRSWGESFRWLGRHRRGSHCI